MFKSGYANAENVFYCLNVNVRGYLTRLVVVCLIRDAACYTSLPYKSLKGHWRCLYSSCCWSPGLVNKVPGRFFRLLLSTLHLYTSKYNTVHDANNLQVQSFCQLQSVNSILSCYYLLLVNNVVLDSIILFFWSFIHRLESFMTMIHWLLNLQRNSGVLWTQALSLLKGHCLLLPWDNGHHRNR